MESGGDRTYASDSSPSSEQRLESELPTWHSFTCSECTRWMPLLIGRRGSKGFLA